jgi:multidrug efflux pump subunit AcrA (membrane-fusion protein)
VEVERTTDEISIIARGLKAGEPVVTDGQLKLAPGSKVSVRPSAGDAP